MSPMRPCGTCRQPYPDGNCPTHPRKGGYRPDRPRHYDRAWRTLQSTVVAAAGFVCAYCGLPGATGDHVVPLSKGGQSAPANVVCACFRCNTSKGDRTLKEWVESGLAPPGAARLLAQRIIEELPV